MGQVFTHLSSFSWWVKFLLSFRHFPDGSSFNSPFIIFLMGQVFTLLSPFSFLGHDPVDSSTVDAHNGWLRERSSSKSAEEMSRCLQDPPGCPEMSRCLQDPPGCPEMSRCLQDPPGCPEMSRCLQDPPGCPEMSRCLQDPPGYPALSADHWKQSALSAGH